jgi:uncharacterized lipoprotein YajG
MRIIAALLTALMLAGCATLPTTGGNVAQVQALARQACGFVPLARTVTELFTVAGGTAFAIAAKICAAVENNPMTEGARGGRTVPRVNGVPLEGRFVRR